MTQDLTPEAVAEMLKRLRLGPEYVYRFVETDHKAADMLEALAAKLAEVKRDRDELRAAKWAEKHTDTMNDMVQMGMARDEAMARAEAAEAEGARLREWTPTDDQVASACLSYRHDFGLMDGSARDGLMWQAKEWLRAWRKEFAALQPKETDQ
jgi:hypothetical protein